MRLMNLDDDEQNVWMIIKVMKMSHSENHVKNTGRDENNQDLTITLLLLLPLPIQRFSILVRLVSPLHLLHLRALVLKPNLMSNKILMIIIGVDHLHHPHRQTSVFGQSLPHLEMRSALCDFKG